MQTTQFIEKQSDRLRSREKKQIKRHALKQGYRHLDIRRETMHRRRECVVIRISVAKAVHHSQLINDYYYYLPGGKGVLKAQSHVLTVVSFYFVIRIRDLLKMLRKDRFSL